MTETSADLVVVGAGIVGLAHAWHAARHGLRVVVVERDERAVGASVRNFGHVCTTAQAGLVLEYALAANEDWRRMGRDAQVPLVEAGTVVVARSEAEQAVLAEFQDERGTDAVRLLSPAETEARLGLLPPGTLAAAHLPRDLRVSPPDALPAVASHLASLGVRFHWRTNVLGLEDDGVRTTAGRIRAARTVLAVGHDVDRFLPAVADDHGLLRCRLRMLEVEPPRGAVVPPALLTGTSMLRYEGLNAMPSAARVRAETDPKLLERVVNLMLTQRPDGRLIVGDTHHSAVTEDPFEDERSDELVLEEAARLLGAPLTVRRRWRGVYASAPSPYLVAEPAPGLTVASVTSGIGMTTAFGFARQVLSDVLVPG